MFLFSNINVFTIITTPYEISFQYVVQRFQTLKTYFSIPKVNFLIKKKLKFCGLTYPLLPFIVVCAIYINGHLLAK